MPEVSSEELSRLFAAAGKPDSIARMDGLDWVAGQIQKANVALDAAGAPKGTLRERIVNLREQCVPEYEAVAGTLDQVGAPSGRWLSDRVKALAGQRDKLLFDLDCCRQERSAQRSEIARLRAEVKRLEEEKLAAERWECVESR